MKISSAQSRSLGSVGLLLLLAVIIVGSILFPPSEWIPAEAWGVMLEERGLSGMILFVVAGMLATSVGLPRQLVAFISGIAYGVLLGVTLSLLAALLGCYLTVRVSRLCLRESVHRRFPNMIEKLNNFVREDVFAKVLVLRLQPFGTNLITNVCVGFTSIPIKVFMSASAVGYVPQMLAFALLGSGIRLGSSFQLILSGVLLLLSIIIGVVVYRRHQRRN